MTELPDGPRGRLLAIALLMLLLGAAWTVVGAPLLELYGSQAARLADQRELLARETRLAASLPALRSAAASGATRGATRGEATPAGTLLGGDSDAIAGASLQGMVQDMANAAGASLASAEALPAEQRGAYRQIGLRVTLSADWPVLVAMLTAVESSRYRLLVDDVQFHAVARIQVGAGSAAPPIDASFTVLGFRPGHEPGPGPSGALRADAAPLQ